MDVWSHEAHRPFISAALRATDGGTAGASKNRFETAQPLEYFENLATSPESERTFQQPLSGCSPVLSHPRQSFNGTWRRIRMILGVSQGVPASEWTGPSQCDPIEVEVPKEGWQSRNHRLHNDDWLDPLTCREDLFKKELNGFILKNFIDMSINVAIIRLHTQPYHGVSQKKIISLSALALAALIPSQAEAWGFTIRALQCLELKIMAPTEMVPTVDFKTGKILFRSTPLKPSHP